MSARDAAVMPVLADLAAGPLRALALPGPGRSAIILGGYLLPLVPGLVIRQILDTLTGHAPAGWNAESLLVLLGDGRRRPGASWRW